jgi:hypothetical protein
MIRRNYIAAVALCFIVTAAIGCGPNTSDMPKRSVSATVATAVPRLRVLSGSDLGGSWNQVSAPAFAAGVGPCTPQRPAPNIDEAHVGFESDRVRLLEALATFASVEDAATVIRGERDSLASCGVGTGYAPREIALGDESVAYTQTIGSEIAAIAVVRSGMDVVALDYVGIDGPPDWSIVNRLLETAIRKLSSG